MRNTEPSCGGAISINHNWFNAHSLHWVWSLLRGERRAAVEAIEEGREVEELVARVHEVEVSHLVAGPARRAGEGVGVGHGRRMPKHPGAC